MSKTTKSPRKVAAAAYRFAVNTLPEHSSRFSPKKYTQAQLFVCLVLKTFFNVDYRGIVEILNDSPELCKDFGLKIVPHFTTLHKATRRLLRYKNMKRLLEATCKRAMRNRNTVKLAAVDGTGLQSGHISSYFLKRRANGKKPRKKTKLTKYPKMAVLADTENHMILSFVAERGPGSDSGHFEKILRRLPAEIKVKCITADGGYDGEANHIFANETLGIETIIPPIIGKKTDNLPRTKYRRRMKQNFDHKRYGQRWQVETVYSMIKRNLTDTLMSRSFRGQCREISLLAITHNLMIVLFVKELFYKAVINNC
jgi:DDE family transposase